MDWAVFDFADATRLPMDLAHALPGRTAARRSRVGQ
jgi:hypothetical protein